MSDPIWKFVIIGVGQIIGFALCAVAIFTDSWFFIPDNYGNVYYNYPVGLVPFHDEKQTWFQVVSIMMYVSFGLFFPLFLFLILAVIHRQNTSRHRLFCVLFIIFTFLIFVLENVSFFLTMGNMSMYLDSRNALMGYSSGLSLASSYSLVFSITIAEILTKYVWEPINDN